MDCDNPGSLSAVLLESETCARELLAAYAQATWRTDANGLVVVDSPSWHAYTGQSFAEFAGNGWLNAIHPDDRASAERQWREAVAAQHKLDAEFRLRHAASGGYRWTNVCAVPLRGAGGTLREWIGMNIDVDDRKRAEETLREAEARYRALFTSVGAGYCIVEVKFDQSGEPIDYRFIEVNPAFERQTGLKDAAGKWMRDLAPAHEQHWFDIYGRVALSGEPVQFEYPAKELGDRWYHVRAFRIGNPEARRVAVLFEDISERKRAELALREGETRLAALFNILPAGVGLMDRDGRVQLHNHELARFMPIDAVASKDPANISRWRAWHSDGSRVVPADFPSASALRGAPTSPMEMLFSQHDGKEIWTRVTTVQCWTTSSA